MKIPTDIAPGDYLLRAEVLALHTAGSLGQAQFYTSCYQITVSGSGSATPSGVLFPGAYDAKHPGILVDIHQKMSTYVNPGPTVYAGGVSKTPGNTKCTGHAASIGPGGKPAAGVSLRTRCVRMLRLGTHADFDLLDALHPRLRRRRHLRPEQHDSQNIRHFDLQILRGCDDYIERWRRRRRQRWLFGGQVRAVWWVGVYWVHDLRCKFPVMCLTAFL